MSAHRDAPDRADVDGNTGGERAEAEANEAVRTLLNAQAAGAAAVVLQAPPGAGKTSAVESAAVFGAAVLGQQVMVATQTKEQSYDLVRRLARDYPRLPVRVGFLVAERGAVPADLLEHPRVAVTDDAADPAVLPAPGARAPCLVVANAAKWSWAEPARVRFDVLVVDEAYQLTFGRYGLLTDLAARHLLVGDPGQIAPVVTCEVERWRGEPAGPHVPAPAALLAKFAGVPRLTLPVSRRLVGDTVSFVQPAFYPDLAFRAVAGPGARGVVAAPSGPGASHAFERVLAALTGGASLAALELPHAITGDHDDDLAEAIAAFVVHLFRRRVHVRDEREGTAPRRLDPAMVGVVCAHVAQVHAVQERLPAGYRDVRVETANRFQGLENSLVLVHHPLAGRTHADAFDTDAGRLCVMLTRHRIACVVFTRAGVREALRSSRVTAPRVIGASDDPSFAGWRALNQLDDQLRMRARVVAASG